MSCNCNYRTWQGQRRKGWFRGDPRAISEAELFASAEQLARVSRGRNRYASGSSRFSSSAMSSRSSLMTSSSKPLLRS